MHTKGGMYVDDARYISRGLWVIMSCFVWQLSKELRRMADMTICLASASPRRREILDQLGISYQVLPQDVDESHRAGETPAAYVKRLAACKAESALASHGEKQGIACLGSDTTVVCDGQVFEKPADQEDAHRMLSSLSGKSHQVLTAVALATADFTEVLLSVSEVTFRVLEDDEISAYWQTGEPADKAGGYGIQGLGALFIESMKGSYSGIMGLPVFETAYLLQKIDMPAANILGQYQ